MVSVTISIMSLIYIFVIFVVFFAKKRLVNKENKIFSYLLIVSLILAVLDVTSGILFLNNTNIYSIFYLILTKFIVLLYIIWDFLMLYYVITISKSEKNDSNISKYIPLILLLFSYAVMLLPLNFETKNNLTYPVGISILLVYILTFILSITIIFILIKNIKRAKTKKFLPLFAYLFLGIIIEEIH